MACAASMRVRSSGSARQEINTQWQTLGGFRARLPTLLPCGPQPLHQGEVLLPPVGDVQDVELLLGETDAAVAVGALAARETLHQVLRGRTALGFLAVRAVVAAGAADAVRAAGGGVAVDAVGAAVTVAAALA